MRIRVALVALAVLTASPPLSPLVSAAGAQDYKVVDGKLQVFGYTLEPRFPIKVSSPPEEDDTLIGLISSPSGRRVIIKVGVRLQTDYWLYDSRKRSTPLKIPAEPRGRHVFTEWHSDDVFEVQSAGMGYSVSDLFRADDLTKKTSTDGLLYTLDLERQLYACFYQDEQVVTGVELGKLFAGKPEKERFPINLDVEYLSDAMLMMEEVEIMGDKLVITHKKRDGTSVREEFTPRLLTEQRRARP